MLARCLAAAVLALVLAVPAQAAVTVADSRFTDCPASWPNCAVEERYSHFANGDHYYCRLTMSSGSDIRSYGSISQISGAEHKADGSWGVEY